MYYNENTIVYFKGQFIKAVDLKGDMYSQSLHYGYGVFEGIRAYKTQNGVRIFKAREHYHRMKVSCEAIGIPYPYDNDELISLTYSLLQKNNLEDAYIRPLITCTPNMALTKGKDAYIMIAAWEWGAYLGEKLLHAKISPYQRPNPKAFKVHAKVTGHYVNSVLACQEAKDTGFDEALLLDSKGFVAEAPGANIFFEKNGILYTPCEGNILAGITRATVLGICADLGIQVVQNDFTTDEVLASDSAFLCGTAAEIIGLASLDKIPFTKNWNDSIGAVIQKAYKNLVLEKDDKSVLNVA
jgi:branched-chain amino acid aminotransferase